MFSEIPYAAPGEEAESARNSYGGMVTSRSQYDDDVIPRVFVGHVVADEERFVRAFDERLRADGLDTGRLDWVLNPGESLIERIAGERLEAGDVVVPVLSRYSVESRWVRDELSTATVREIDNACRLLPVLLDRVAVPIPLKATVWQAIPDPTSYDVEYEHILAGIFNRQLAPPESVPPRFRDDRLLSGLTPTANALLFELGRRALSAESDVFSAEQVRSVREALGLDHGSMLKEVVRLGREGLVLFRRQGMRIQQIHMTLSGLIAYLIVSDHDLERSYVDVSAVLVYSKIRRVDELAARTGQSEFVVELVLRLLDRKHVIDFVRGPETRGSQFVRTISPLLEDELAPVAEPDAAANVASES